MKLLLTSAGLKNKTLAKAVLDLVGKPAEEINVAFIPTAMNVEGKDKTWFIKNLDEFKEQNYKTIDIVDISALPKEIWQPRLESADVLFFSGGNSAHLMRWIEESGLKKILPELLKTRIWVGISAGSIVVSPTLAVSNKDKAILYEKEFGLKVNNGLGFIDFYIRPHLNTKPHSSKEVLEKIAKEVPQTIYGLDDQMAIKVVDGKVEVIGEGDYLVFNK